MYLKRIYLSKFRNYDELLLDLNHGINIIIGENGQGKTNLLESIYVLALTKSHRSFIDNNLIKKNYNYCQIKGIVQDENIESTYEIELRNKNKILKIDGDIIKTISNYISKVNIIIFYPDDLELIKGSPNIRRRFLNIEISQLNNKYINILSEYNKVLKLRNNYIKSIYETKTVDKSYFDILNDYYIKAAVDIYVMRYQFIEILNKYSQDIFYNISGLTHFFIKYKTSFKFENFDKEKMIQLMKDKIDNMYETEIRLKSTILGPHKDDIEFYIGDKNIKNFGSQGQQRMAVLALKLAEIHIFKEKTGKYPILLLDDVFSELDDEKKNNLLKYIKNDIQTIITTTELSNIDEQIKLNSKIIEIKEGKITTEEEE